MRRKSKYLYHLELWIRVQKIISFYVLKLGLYDADKENYVIIIYIFLRLLLKKIICNWRVNLIKDW